VVEASRGDLERVDFPPFAALADAPMAMTAHVVYAAIDKAAPATLSKKVIQSIIRKHIGFRGLLMSDDLSMKALSGSLGERAAGAINAGCDKFKNSKRMGERAAAALAAGCDMLLHCNGTFSEMEEVAQAAGPLKGKGLARARRALKAANRPRPFEKAAALKDLERLAIA
jgi:beta-N-acetylhexosaminidase